MTLVVSYLFQQESISILDLSYMYHTFRGQSTLKLYGLIFALEVSEKIHTMIGKYLYSRIKEKLAIPTVNSLFLVPEIVACFVYTLCHALTIYM